MICKICGQETEDLFHYVTREETTIFDLIKPYLKRLINKLVYG